MNENYLMAYGLARHSGAPDGVALKFARPFLLKTTTRVLSADVMKVLWDSMGWAPRKRKSAAEDSAEASLLAQIEALTAEPVDA